MREILLRIEPKCNERCVFCNVYGKKEYFLSKRETIMQLNKLKQERDEIIVLFTGGEPTLNRHLLFYISYAKKHLPVNCEIGIQTNALRLSYMGYCDALRKAGLDYAFVPFHHFSPRLFNRMTRSKDSFKFFEKGIRNLILKKVVLIINIVLNKLNYKSTKHIVRYVHENFPELNSISFSFVQPTGFSKNNYSIVPPYSSAKKYLIEAYEYCIRKNIKFFNPNCGVPLCIIKGYEQFSADFLDTQNENYKKCNNYSEKDKVKTDKCFKCFMNKRCSGVWKNYIDMFSDGDLRPYINPKENE